MTLEQCYLAVGGDYADVLAHLRKEERIRKFLLRFPEDPSYAHLCQAMESRQYDEAFRAAHTIKGLCQNLGLGRLYQSASRLTEALRAGTAPEDGALFKRVQEDYASTIAAIGKLEEGGPQAR